MKFVNWFNNFEMKQPYAAGTLRDKFLLHAQFNQEIKNGCVKGFGEACSQLNREHQHFASRFFFDNIKESKWISFHELGMKQNLCNTQTHYKIKCKGYNCMARLSMPFISSFNLTKKKKFKISLERPSLTHRRKWESHPKSSFSLSRCN